MGQGDHAKQASRGWLLQPTVGGGKYSPCRLPLTPTAWPASETQEEDGLDLSEHGESMLEAGNLKSVCPPGGPSEPAAIHSTKSTVHPDIPRITSNSDG